MNDLKPKVATNAAPLSPVFNTISNNSAELRQKIDEINSIIANKITELVGAVPSSVERTQDEPIPESWTQKIATDQNVSLALCSEILTRLEDL